MSELHCAEFIQEHLCSDPVCPDLVKGLHPCHDPECLLKEHQETIRYMAENAHQAYHETGSWWECHKNMCRAAQRALPNLVKKLKG